MAVENMRAPEIGGLNKECWYMYFLYFNFVSDQLTHPQPGKELSWSEAGKRRGLTSHPNMAGRAP